MANDELPQLPKLTPVANPLNLVPVNLKEAALDSPTFRATTVHFGEQIDAVERWLDSYTKAASRLANEVTSIENLVNNYLSCALPPQAISEAALDQDYTVLALRRYNDGAREFWTATIKWMKKVESSVVNPIKLFLHHDLASLKALRRNLDQAQRTFDASISRYASQSKTKETSSLREDAFQVHEARRAYLKASLDFCVAAPQVRASLDKLLVKIFSDRWRDMKNSRDALSSSFSRWTTDIERVRGWSKEMENYERVFAQELQVARRQIEESAESSFKPSRDLDSYTASTVPFASNSTGPLGSPKKVPNNVSEKQGWLFQRTLVGKPARTLWVRRWFYVKNGVFGWLAQSARFSSVEESEKIGVLLCGVRPAMQEERRFCFEVKTKDSTLILQAETQNELMDWIAAFEVVKRKALENPTGASLSAAMSGAPFAITPPVAPEFAVRVSEHHQEESIERANTMAPDAPSTARQSTDVRRVTERDAESKTEKLKQTLRKGTSGPPSAPGGIGGIASLIAASHQAMPIAPMTPPTPVSTTSDFKKLFNSTIPNTSLAPSTLANPPAPTTLSKSAIIVGAERGLALSGSGDGGIPGGLMANLWGSTNWGYINRLEKSGLRKPIKAASRVPSRSTTPPLQLEGIKQETGVGGAVDAKDMFPHLEHAPTAPMPSTSFHRKSASASPDPVSLKAAMSGDNYPSYYPASLKLQDIQFRMLFPNLKQDDKLVLVFRATWNPSDQQEFPGRVYVTPKELFFFSNHLGMVLITGVRLDSISEITAAPGKDCDFLFIHLRDGVTSDGSTRIAVKIFLESLKLLRRRLDFLVHNEQSDEPLPLQEIIKVLIKMEVTEGDESPMGESWEDISAEVGMDESTPRKGQDVKTSLHIDGSLFSDPAKRVHRNATKFRLPAHPVEFTPQGFKFPIIEKQYDVTAKSLFHVLAGDKSAVFQILYCQRGAQKLVQGPWEQPDENHHRRQIKYEIQNSKKHFEVSDYQVIDVLNDHLCYVITERKTAWFLPKSNYFTLVLKIVITHVAKSHCRLSIFGRVEWSKTPLLGTSLIDHQANSYLQSYSTSLSEIATDQASRLGVQGSTSARKAIAVFGSIGQQTQSMELLASDLAPADLKGSKRMRYRSLPRLILYAARRMAITYSFVLLGWIIQLVKWGFETITANRVLFLILIGSITTNMFYSSRDTWTWWQERKAGQYMSRLGVRPNAAMTRSIWIKDLDQVISMTQVDGVNITVSSGDAGACRSAFSSIVTEADPTTSSLVPQNQTIARSTRSMLARITKTRHNFGSYRHDLLVALRMVGSVEREMLQAEWENWVMSESNRCRQVETLLHTAGRNDTQKLRSWWEQYCMSCIGALSEIQGGRTR
ncbi:transcription factor SipA3 [Microthyrium microscopicum]|uniref:Transcription factor SipA3 n=1 Tax=Microthyrium microscopicum TaxID=703497 RepID=A0A6A6U254_9PEZI|nr:transcription factor SipA3 [Microthyrium microscopicum]